MSRPQLFDRRYPWAIGKIGLRPAGLREAVLQELYRGSMRGPQGRPHAMRSPIADTVRRWCAGVDCTPEQWAALVRALGLAHMTQGRIG